MLLKKKQSIMGCGGSKLIATDDRQFGTAINDENKPKANENKLLRPPTPGTV